MNNKKLQNNEQMIKPGGRHIVSFVPDEDTHFCNVCIRSRKTGQLTASHYILASEVPQWIARFEREGYKKEGQKIKVNCNEMLNN